MHSRIMRMKDYYRNLLAKWDMEGTGYLVMEEPGNGASWLSHFGLPTDLQR